MNQFIFKYTKLLFSYSLKCSPFREQNNMRAVNRTCERFCAWESHACLSHWTDSPSQQNMTGTIDLFSKFVIVYLYKRKKFNIYNIQYKLGRFSKKKRNWKPTQKSPIKPTFRFGRRSGRRNQQLRYTIDIYRIIQRWRS